MATTYRRFSTECKLRVIESSLAVHGSAKAIANAAGMNHSLLHFWLRNYERGELSASHAGRDAPGTHSSRDALFRRNLHEGPAQRRLLRTGVFGSALAALGQGGAVGGIDKQPVRIRNGIRATGPLAS